MELNVKVNDRVDIFYKKKNSGFSNYNVLIIEVNDESIKFIDEYGFECSRIKEDFNSNNFTIKIKRNDNNRQ